MPTDRDGAYQASENGLTVTAFAPADDPRRVHLRLAGEIDLATSTVLAATLDWLSTRTPGSVLMDLSAVTFASAALPNFVVRLAQTLPDRAELILCRPQPATSLVLQMTDLATIATVRSR